jgi:hypothetical protein
VLGVKDASEVWAVGVLAVATGPATADGPEGRELPQNLQELWEERTAIMTGSRPQRNPNLR